MANAATKSSPNQRHVVLAPMRHVDRRRGETSQMWFHGAEVAYVFPSDEGVTLIAWMGPKQVLNDHRERPLEFLKERIRALPDAPHLQDARASGRPPDDEGLPQPVAAAGRPEHRIRWRCDASASTTSGA